MFNKFIEAVNDAIERVLTESIDTHKNLLVTFQNIIADALNDEGLDLLKKGNLALRFLV